MDDEQKIFEQVNDSYFCESANFKVTQEIDLKSIKFKHKDPTVVKKNNEIIKKKRESKSKALLIEAEYPENLPEGWKKVVVQRTTGATAGKFDVFFNTPSGRKLRSKNEIRSYSTKHNLDLDLKEFAFSRPRRDSIENNSPIKKSKSRRKSINCLDKETNGVQDGEETSNPVESQVINASEETDFIEISAASSETVSEFTNGCDKDYLTAAAPIKSDETIGDDPCPIDSNKSGNSLLELDLDVDKDKIGKTFKIERPLSFASF